MIEIMYPDRSLWPNGRAHYMAKAREAKKLRTAAAWATKAALSSGLIRLGDSPIPVHIVCHPKARGRVPDRDGIIGAAKSAIDGIADALNIDDRHFAAPTVEIASERTGKFIFYVGERS